MFFKKRFGIEVWVHEWLVFGWELFWTQEPNGRHKNGGDVWFSLGVASNVCEYPCKLSTWNVEHLEQLERGLGALKLK